MTLVGTAGVGKTCLAVHLGRSLLGDFRDAAGGGVWLCDLTEARTLGAVATIVGGVLAIPLASAATGEDAVARLGE